MQRKFLLFVLSALMVVACGDTDDPIELEISVPVSVEEVKYNSIEAFITTTSTVNANKDVTLRSETSGFYRVAVNPRTNRRYVLGEFVRQGDILIYLENPELENNTKIESQKLNLNISESEYEKQKSLYEKGGVTLRELKNAERTYIDAKYNYENALLQLSKLKITAPFYGVIVELPYYTEDTKVEANLMMIQIMDYSKLYMNINLPAKEMSKLNIRQKVRVTNYTLPEDTLWGQVKQISPAVDPETRSFKASIDVNNPEWLLRPGMFVKADIVIANRDSTIVIPKDIILSKQRGKTVFIVEKGAAQERVISTSLENTDEVEVIEGLKVGERLVVRGFETLRHTSKVKIIR